MKNLTCASSLFLILLIASCTESPTGPSNSSQSPSNVISLFAGQSTTINVRLQQAPSPNVYPEYYTQNDWLSQYGYLWVGYSDTSRRMLTLMITASNLTHGPVTGIIKIALGNNTVYQPISINVVDFYYASRLDNNTNDTIKLKSGLSFLLQLTCRDSAGNVVSNQQIGRLLGGWSDGHVVFPHSYISLDAIYCSSYYLDTTSFYYLFSTIPNVTFSPEDTGQYFQMQLSNKTFNIPIRLIN